MPASNTEKLSVNIKDELYRNLEQSARSKGISLDEKVEEVLDRYIKSEEDAYFIELARERRSTFSKEDALSYDEVFGRIEKQSFSDEELDID